MTRADATPPPSQEAAHPRRWLRPLCLAALLAILAFEAHRNWAFVHPPAPPLVQIEGFDPAAVESIEAARSTVLASPRSAPAWGKLGMVLYANEQYAAADTALEQAAALSPRDPSWPYLRGVIAAMEQPQAAVPLLERARELRPELPALRLRLADVLLSLGRLDEAEREVAPVLRRDPANPHALLGMGKIKIAANDFEAAEARLRMSAAQSVTAKESSRLLASIARRRNQPEDAARYARDAAMFPADQPPPDPILDEAVSMRTGLGVDLSRADALLARDESARAVDLMQATTRRYANSDDAWRKLGEVLMAQNRNAEAEQAMRRAVAIKPEVAEWRNHLGVTLLRQDRVADAEACFQTALRLSPAYPEAHYNAGLCLRRRGALAEAAQEFRKATQLKTDFADAYLFLANVLATEGNSAEALQQVKMGLKLKPGDAMGRKLLDRLASDAE